MANTPDNFSEKVLAKLKEKNMAVDLTDEPIDSQPQVEAQSEPMQAFSDQGFTAFATSGTAPTSGGNKDILIIPGFGGTTASAASQINFYWIEPGTIPSDNTDATGTTRRSTLFNYSDDANNPVLAFGGYNGTLNLAPAATYGGVTTNTVAKIWIHPFTGTIDTDYMNFGTNTVTASTAAGVLSWVPGSTRLSVGDGTNAKQIAYTSDVTSANQITATTSTNTTMYPLFVDNVGDGSTNQIVWTGNSTYSPVLDGSNGNFTIVGDLAVNGLDITTTGTTTASLFNTNAAALNIGGAATAVSIGSSTGTFTVGNTTVTFTNATNFTGTASAITFFGSSTSVAAFGAATTLGLGSSTGTATINNTTVAFPNATSFTGTSAAVTFLGAATTATAFGAATTFGIGSSTGTLTIGNPTITTNTSSLTLFNTNATTVAAFGAATSLSMGTTSGTATINNTTVAFPNATSFTGTSAAVTFLGAATTATAFGAAATLTLGTTSGTGTIRNATIDFPNATTISGSTGLATVFASANPSSLAVFGSATTATIFGSATSLSMGTTSGTATINNTTVAFPNATSFTGTSAAITFLGSSTSVTAFGAASTLTLGTTSGTGTIRNATIDFPNATTISGSTGLATVFASANPSSLAVFGSATTATIFGSATSLSMGTTSGTATINNTTVAFPNATTFTGTSGTITFLGGASTVTAFGGATALTLGNTTGTTTIRNTTVTFSNATNFTGVTGTVAFLAEPTTVTAFAGATTSTMFGTTATSTINFGSGTLASGNTRTINIGANAVATSTSVIYIGSALNTSSSTISFNGNRIQGVGEPTQPSDAATKYYVDSFQQGLDLHESVRAVSATAIGTSVLYFQQNAASSTLGTVIGTSYIESTNNETLSTTYFDNLSTALSTGQRVLVALGASTTTYNINGVTTAPTGGTNVMNGIYTVTSVGSAGSKWRLDRATDTNDNIELQGGTFTFVQEGAIYADSGWTCTNNTATTPISIGSDAISWTQFSGAGLILAGDGLVKNGNTIDAVGTLNRISVSANAIDISASYVGQNTITTLGTVTTGTWNASVVGAQWGGTGTSSLTSNAVLVGNGTGTVTLTSTSTQYKVFVTGASGVPAWGTVSLDQSAAVTGTLPLANGGLGTTTFTQYGVIYGNLGTSILVTAAGSTDQVLKSGGGSGAPSFGSINLASSNAVGSSILPIGNGGTATSSFATTNGFVYYDGAKLVTSGAANAGQLLLSATTATAAAWTTVTGDVTINGTGTTAIGANKVTDAMLRQSAGLSVIGRSANTTGNVADITASTVDTVLRYSGTTIGFGSINLASSNTVGSSILPVGNGGTGTSSITAAGVVYMGSTAATGLLSVAPATANKHLVSTGSGTTNYPVWSTATMATTYAAGTILYASSLDTVTGLATTATAALVSNSSGTPSWTSGATGSRVLRTDGSAITFAQVVLSSDVTGTLGVGNGGTGTSSLTSNAVLVGNGASAVTLTSTSTQYKVFVTGASGVPAWGTVALDQAAAISGTLPAGNGGTGSNSSFTANALVYASSTTALSTGSLLTWIPGTNSGTGSTAALYVNPTSLTSGTAVNINVPSGATSGKIIVGQLNGTDKFSVDANGNLRATTKSFDIEHPTKPGMRLVYGVLEGPEHGVYHRGTIEGKGKLVVELPEYWHKLVGENYTIQLTPWGNYAVHIVEKTENYFIIELSSNALVKKFKSIKVDYIIHGSRLDAPLEIEQ